MSAWIEIDDDDIDIDLDMQEVNLLVTQNDQGNVYATLTVVQIENIYDITHRPPRAA